MKPAVVVLPVMVMLLTTMTAMPAKATTCNRHPLINGCSIPFGLRLPYQDTFTPACDRHDVCYGCGVLYAVPKAQCDRAFLTDMREACTRDRQRGVLTADSEIACEAMAEDVFYEAVKTFGHLYYPSRTEPYCRQDWVTPCLPSGSS